MNLGILITNYNTETLTNKCIMHSLKYAELPIDRFVIIDDCSKEEFTVTAGDQVEVFRNHVNLGLIRSLNRGLEILQTDLILILDSDAWPLENYVAKVKSYFAENPKVGIATFQTINSQGHACASYEAEPGILSLILGQHLYSRYLRFFKNSKKINVFTCAMVIRKEVLNEIGDFDKNFDWLELDHDLCMRASRKGWEIGVMPIQAFHAGSGTPQQVSHRVIRFYKNRWYLLKKFDKVRLESFTAGLIILRLALEFLLIWTFGFFFFKKLEIIKDKANSRRIIIKYFLMDLNKNNNKPMVPIR